METRRLNQDSQYVLRPMNQTLTHLTYSFLFIPAFSGGITSEKWKGKAGSIMYLRPKFMLLLDIAKVPLKIKTPKQFHYIRFHIIDLRSYYCNAFYLNFTKKKSK